MKNSQKGFVAPVLLIVILVLAVAGGMYFYQKGKTKIPEVSTTTQQISTEVPAVNNTPAGLTDEQKVLKAAREVIAALGARDYQKLERLASPDGLSVNLYPRLDLNKNLITRSEISNISQDTKTYLWGYTDGKGDPINLTRKDFLAEWIYTNEVDYLKAPNVAVNKNLGEGNSVNTIKKDVGNRTYAAFHFPGFDQKFEGMDWTTLYLVFDSVNGEYKLRGIAKDNWTI